jgi:cytochrome oxidase Cu insertion factor (SCO1/SenC/PrrC family)
MLTARPSTEKGILSTRRVRLNHTLRVFLIDPGGNIRNIYSSDTLDPRLVLADVRTLLMESDFARSPD